MALTYFKIRRKGTTDQFSSGGSVPIWAKQGKTWTDIGHIKSHLRQVDQRRKPCRSSYRQDYADYDEAEIVTFEAVPVEVMDVSVLWDLVQAKMKAKQAKIEAEQEQQRQEAARREEEAERELLRKLKKKFPEED